MVSNIIFMQIRNYNPIFHICAINYWQKQFNLFIIQSYDTQFTFYLFSQIAIQSELLCKLITLLPVNFHSELHMRDGWKLKVLHRSDASTDKWEWKNKIGTLEEEKRKICPICAHAVERGGGITRVIHLNKKTRSKTPSILSTNSRQQLSKYLKGEKHSLTDHIVLNLNQHGGEGDRGHVRQDIQDALQQLREQRRDGRHTEQALGGSGDRGQRGQSGKGDQGFGEESRRDS